MHRRNIIIIISLMLIISVPAFAQITEYDYHWPIEIDYQMPDYPWLWIQNVPIVFRSLLTNKVLLREFYDIPDVTPPRTGKEAASWSFFQGYTPPGTLFPGINLLSPIPPQLQFYEVMLPYSYISKYHGMPVYGVLGAGSP